MEEARLRMVLFSLFFQHSGRRSCPSLTSRSKSPLLTSAHLPLQDTSPEDEVKLAEILETGCKLNASKAAFVFSRPGKRVFCLSLTELHHHSSSSTVAAPAQQQQHRRSSSAAAPSTAGQAERGGEAFVVMKLSFVSGDTPVSLGDT